MEHYAISIKELSLVAVFQFVLPWTLLECIIKIIEFLNNWNIEIIKTVTLQ